MMIIKIVDTFIPPAIEPGPAPINMNKIVKTFDGWLSKFWGTVSNPAVRVVTDWKRAFIILSPRGRVLKLFVFSKKKYTMNPSPIKLRVIPSTTLL